MSRKETGWSNVDRPQQGGSSRFISLEPDQSTVIRILDDAPVTFHQHRISYKDPNTDREVFATVPATRNPDDDWVDQQTNRYPSEPRHAIRAVIFTDGGEPERIGVLVGGVTIFRPLKKLHERHGDLSGFDIVISRDGEGMATKYDVSAAPKSFDLDVEHWYDEMEDTPDLAWDAIFPDVSAEDQQRMVEERGIDINYDPVQEAFEQMDEETAESARFSFGKYGPDHFPRGKLIKEVAAIDPGYVRWAAEKATSNTEVAAVCRYWQAKLSGAAAVPKVERAKAISPPPAEPKPKPKAEKPKAKPAPEPEADPEVEEGGIAPWTLTSDPESYLKRWHGKGGKHQGLALAHLAAEGKEWDEESGQARPVGEGAPPAAPEASSSAPAEEDGQGAPGESEGDGEAFDRDAVTEECKAIFREKFENAADIVATIQKHGDGKTRMDDLTQEQLQALHRELVLV